MSDKPVASAGGPERAGWIAWLKPVIGALAGLMSGAVMMYMSPLLDKVFKPAKPVANFAADADGLAVTFHNRSLGHHGGWWDFGDGSPLELVHPEQEVVTHEYEEPGSYTAKLVVRNLLGEPDERSVTLRLDAQHGEPPQIEALDAIPISPGSIAPATFRVVSKVKNAKVCVWDLDDDRPLDIVSDCSGGLDRLVTFEKPGGYVIKLAAVNGNHASERSEIVNVLERPIDMVTAVLTVADQATQVETITTPFSFTEQFPAQLKDNVYPFQKQAPAKQGFQIIDVRLQKTGAPGPRMEGKSELAVDASSLTGLGSRNVRLSLSPDRKGVKLSGELFRDPMTGKKGTAQPNVTVPVQIVQEKRSNVQREPLMVTASFRAPGSTLLALPPVPKDWVGARRQVRMQLLEGDRVAFPDSLLPRNKSVTVQNRRFLLSAEVVGEHIRVDLNEDRATPPAAH